jgi:hypothetical protein
MTLTTNDILSPDRFHVVRPQMELRVLDAKRLRRVQVGPDMNFLFENKLTMQWQVQEMIRVEGIATEHGVAHELATYNELLPTSDSLSTTLLIDVLEPEARDALLHKLMGLHDCVVLEIEGQAPAKAMFIDTQFNEARVSSVQFIRIPFSAAQRAAFGDLNLTASLRVDHPCYRATTPISGSTRGALIDDMRGS